MNLLIAYSILAMSAVGLQGQVLTSTGPMQVVRSGAYSNAVCGAGR